MQFDTQDIQRICLQFCKYDPIRTLSSLTLSRLESTDKNNIYYSFKSHQSFSLSSDDKNFFKPLYNISEIQNRESNEKFINIHMKIQSTDIVMSLSQNLS